MTEDALEVSADRSRELLVRGHSRSHVFGISVRSSGNVALVGTALEEKLATVGHTLQDLIARQNLLDAIEFDLKEVTRDKPFTVWNEVVWLMIFDTISLLRINLGAWGKSIYEKGGLIGDLQSQHRKSLPRDPPGFPGQQNVRIQAFTRLFSCYCEPLPTDAAFTSLRHQVEAHMKPVLDDRHERAHAYEKGSPVQSTDTLDHAGLREALRYAKQVFNDLLLLTPSPRRAMEPPRVLRLSPRGPRRIPSRLVSTVQRPGR